MGSQLAKALSLSGGQGASALRRAPSDRGAAQLEEAVVRARRKLPALIDDIERHLQDPTRESQAAATFAKLLLDIARTVLPGEAGGAQVPTREVLVLTTPEGLRAEMERRKLAPAPRPESDDGSDG